MEGIIRVQLTFCVGLYTKLLLFFPKLPTRSQCDFLYLDIFNRMSYAPTIINGVFNPNDFQGNSSGYVTLDYLEDNYPNLAYFSQQLSLKYNVSGGVITGLATDSIGFSGPSAVLTDIVCGSLTGGTGSFTSFSYTSGTGSSENVQTITANTGSITNLAFTAATGSSLTLSSLSGGIAALTSFVECRTLYAGGDSGANAGYNGFTNIVSNTLSSGLNVIHSTGSVGGTANAGYLKFYVSTTPVWVPYSTAT